MLSSKNIFKSVPLGLTNQCWQQLIFFFAMPSSTGMAWLKRRVFFYGDGKHWNIAGICQNTLEHLLVISWIKNEISATLEGTACQNWNAGAELFSSRSFSCKHKACWELVHLQNLMLVSWSVKLFMALRVVYIEDIFSCNSYPLHLRAQLKFTVALHLIATKPDSILCM